jgi:amino acid transporter
MGRDDAIPKRFFGQLHPRTRIPANNIVLVGGIALAGAFLLDYDERGYALGAQLLNFGALAGFMGVNLSALTHYSLRGRDRRLRHLLPPILGFLICFYLWISLARTAQIIGLVWLACGVLYGAWRTGGYRRPLAMFTAQDEPS